MTAVIEGELPVASWRRERPPPPEGKEGQLGAAAMMIVRVSRAHVISHAPWLPDASSGAAARPSPQLPTGFAVGSGADAFAAVENE